MIKLYVFYRKMLRFYSNETSISQVPVQSGKSLCHPGLKSSFCPLLNQPAPTWTMALTAWSPISVPASCLPPRWQQPVLYGPFYIWPQSTIAKLNSSASNQNLFSLLLDLNRSTTRTTATLHHEGYTPQSSSVGRKQSSFFSHQK